MNSININLNNSATWKLPHNLEEENILPELSKQVPQTSIFIFYRYTAQGQIH